MKTLGWALGLGVVALVACSGNADVPSTPRTPPPTFALVSAGSFHTCGLTHAGTAYCWGANESGELGDGTTTESTAPVAVNGGLTFAALSVGAAWTCGLTPAGAAYCWGNNGAGELGNGGTTNSTTPVAVSGGLTFALLSAGGDHNCGRTPAGVAYCWGYNAWGQLGASSAQTCPSASPDLCSTTPVMVTGGLAFAAISAGDGHTCGLTANGVAYCWGYNADGRLGIGTTSGPESCPRFPNPPVSCSTAPVAVSGGLTFTGVSAGQTHNCGVTSGGAAYCWGTGALGSSSVDSSATPVPVYGGLTFAAVSADGPHSCSVTTVNAAFCWGDGAGGDLGNGTTTGSLTPVAVVGGLTFAVVSAGGFHTCGVNPAGVAYCWGDNSYGELGDGTTTNRTTPVAVAAPQ